MQITVYTSKGLLEADPYESKRVFDEKFPVRKSLEQQVFTLGMHLICVSSGSYLQATEVSHYSSLLTL